MQTTGKLKSQEDAFETVRGEGSQILSAAKNVATNIADKANNIAEKAQDYGEMALEQTNKWVRRNPTSVILTGVGIGVLVGFLLGRR